MGRKERVVEAYDYLRSIGQAHTKYDVADKMGRNRTSVSSAMNGNERFLTEKFLLDFNSAYEGLFNNEWLLNGEGEMLAPQTIINQTFNRGKNINSGTATQVGDSTASPVMEEVIKQQSEQIGKLIDDNVRRGEQIDKLISLLSQKM